LLYVCDIDMTIKITFKSIKTCKNILILIFTSRHFNLITNNNYLLNIIKIK
jgi:hypothetical protein